MEARQLVARPDFSAEYAAWLAHPMTVAIRQVVDGALRPYGLSEPSGDSALYQLGLFVGQSGMRGLIFEMERFVEHQRRAEAFSALKPQYATPRAGDGSAGRAP